MAEEIYNRSRKVISSSNPEPSEIAGHLEDEARLMHESGYPMEARDLIRWALELRQKGNGAGT